MILLQVKTKRFHHSKPPNPQFTSIGLIRALKIRAVSYKTSGRALIRLLMYSAYALHSATKLIKTMQLLMKL
jgi:hypothetical protein